MTDPRQEPPFIHSHALVESEDIGPGSRIWAFAHMLRGAIIGADCNVCDHSYIDEDIVIGDPVTIKGQVYMMDGYGSRTTYSSAPTPPSPTIASRAAGGRRGNARRW